MDADGDDSPPPLAADSDVEVDEGHGPAAKAPPPRRAIVPASSSSASAPVVPAPPPEGVGRAERRGSIRRRLKAGEEDPGIVPAATGVGAMVARMELGRGKRQVEVDGDAQAAHLEAGLPHKAKVGEDGGMEVGGLVVGLLAGGVDVNGGTKF